MSGLPEAINSSTGGGGGGASYLTEASNLLWCVDGGNYATLQAAVNAAVDSTTILVGVKGSGSWGDVVLPANKRINIVGLQSRNGLIAQVNSITFSPTTGLNINLNQCTISNLFINLATNVNNPALTFGRTAPARLRVYDCYTNANSGTGDLILANNSHASSSLYIDGSTVDAGASTKIGLNASCYVRLNNIKDFSGGSKALLISGTTESNYSNFTCNQVNEVISVTATGKFFAGLTNVINSTTNGSGILIATGGLVTYAQSGFSVNSGTGYCVRGSAGGIFVYDRITFSDSVLQAQNKKIQNTLTLATFSTTPSIVA